MYIQLILNSFYNISVGNVFNEIGYTNLIASIQFDKT